MKLEKILKIKADLRCETGLHIGGGDTEIHIGGVDNQVIKNPITNLPYIPGSSLKGKMRSLMEWRTGKVQEKPLGVNDLKNAGRDDVAVKNILKLFGIHGNKEGLTEELVSDIGPTRLSFWDCPINKKWVDSVRDKNLLTVEVKSENTINRISGTATNPRQSERVPAGASFDFCLSIRKLDVDNEDELVKEVLIALKLLEFDSLGGSGSRGYGKVKFENLTIEGYDGKICFEDLKPF